MAVYSSPCRRWDRPCHPWSRSTTASGEALDARWRRAGLRFIAVFATTLGNPEPTSSPPRLRSRDKIRASSTTRSRTCRPAEPYLRSTSGASACASTPAYYERSNRPDVRLVDIATVASRPSRPPASVAHAVPPKVDAIVLQPPFDAIRWRWPDPFEGVGGLHADRGEGRGGRRPTSDWRWRLPQPVPWYPGRAALSVHTQHGDVQTSSRGWIITAASSPSGRNMTAHRGGGCDAAENGSPTSNSVAGMTLFPHLQLLVLGANIHRQAPGVLCLSPSPLPALRGDVRQPGCPGYPGLSPSGAPGTSR
jgi:hypothetical protein